MAEIKEAKAAKPSYVGFGQPKYDYFGKTTIDSEDEEFAWGRSKYPDSHQLEAYEPISKTPSYKPTTSASELSDEVITKALKQLITGSVILPNDSKINLTQWAKNMESLFDRRFRTMKDFESWAVNYVDFLVWDLNDPDKINTDDTCLIGSQQMLDMLGDLPTNKYIKSFISILEGYSYKD